MPEIPDIPTHAVPIDQPTSPEWAQQERWDPIIRQLCAPCKEHGTYPFLGEQFLKLRSDGKLALGNLTVHCPDKGCKYYAGDYRTDQWKALMR